MPHGPLAAVALGGGHGLHATLSALRMLADRGVADRVTAVVTVADDGGSSGRLRRELGLLPPGDLRMALAALAGEHLATQAAQRRPTGRRALDPAPAAPFRRHRRPGRARRREPAARRADGGPRRPGDGTGRGRPGWSVPGAGYCPWHASRSTSRPRSRASRTTTRSARTASAARSPSRPPPAGCAGSGCCPSGRRPAPTPWPRYGPRTCCCSARAPGSPACCRTC